MADLQKTVEIIFGAVDNTGSGLSSISNNLNSVVDNASNITAPLAKVAEFALAAETAVLSLAAAYGGYAMVKAAEFETAQIDLNKVLSDADPAIGEFTDTVIKLSEQYGVSSAAVLQGIANFKQAGFSAKDAADLQKNALDLMIAGDIDAAAASQVLITSIKGFGVEASQASRFVEALNNVSNDYATDVQQLATGMARVAPIAKTMGFSFEETTGLLTPMIEIFGSGEQAAEGLKTGLLKLTDDTKSVRDALASIGVSQFDTNNQMRSGKDIFYDVANAFSKLDENQKAYLTQQLVGIDQAPRMVLAFNNIAKIQEVTASALANTGSVTKEVGLRLESTAKQADIFKTSFDNLAISIGTGLNQQFSGVLTGSSDVLQALRDIVDSGGLEPFFNALKPVVADFATTLENVAKNLPDAFKQVDFTGLIDAFKDLGGEVAGIFDGIDLNTPDGLAKAIQFVVDSLESLTLVTSGVVEAWGEAIKRFIDGQVAFNNLDDSAKKTVGDVSGAAQIFESLKDILLGVIGAVGGFGNALAAIAGIKVAGTIIEFGGALKSIEFLGAAASAEKLAAALTLPTAAAGLATLAAVGFAVKENVGAWDDYKNRQDAVSTSTANLAANQAGIKDRLQEISQRTGIAVTSMDELNRAVDDGRLVFNEATGAYEAAGTGIRDYDAEVSAAADSGSTFADAVNQVAAGLGLAKDGAKEAVNSFGTLEEAQKGFASELASSNNATIQYKDGVYVLGDALDSMRDSTNQAGDATKSAANKASEGSKEWKTVQEIMLATSKQTNDFTVQMGELANKRYEIDVRAAVDLQTANIEAETSRINAALNSTTATIDTLTTGATDLWATFGEKAGFSGAEEIKNAALNMERRLDDELAIKKEFTDAIVEKLRAETFRLTSGEPLISIDARELAPELELVFDKILKYTQVKATQQGMAMLVGL